jgi:hypothetical protein
MEDYYNLKDFTEILENRANDIIRGKVKHVQLHPPTKAIELPDILLGDADGYFYITVGSPVYGTTFRAVEPDQFGHLVSALEPPQALKDHLH